MELLLHWMRKQEIDDKMLYKNAAIKQECFIRDQICMRLLHTHSFVISTHRSKSIVLPVYAFTMENGIKVICRENFYGWKLSVKLPKDRPCENIIPEDLLEGGYNENASKCYIEGFKDEWIFEEFINESHTLQIDLDKETVTDVELFDNGDANYYFTTDEPLPDNTATMEAFLDMVDDTDESIEWDYDGSQAFGKMRNGRTIQIDAGGDGDFTHHLVSVKIIK